MNATAGAAGAARANSTAPAGLTQGAATVTEPAAVIAVGASAGGVEALMRLAAGLPPDLDAAVLVVVHVRASADSVLPRILDRAGPLAARHAKDGDELRAGRILVAPPDCHLVVEDGTVRLERGPKENGHRPAVDPLFRTVAQAYGRRAIGVVLSGARGDGAAGLAAMEGCGGTTVVQSDPLHPGMPTSALAQVAVDHVLELDRIAGLLAQLVAAFTRSSDTQGGAVREPDLSRHLDDGRDDATGLTCPECGGALWEIGATRPATYRCHVGHAYSEEALADEQAKAVERAVFAAVRALEERAGFLRRLIRRIGDAEAPKTVARFEAQAEEAEAHAEAIRRTLLVPRLGPDMSEEERAHERGAGGR
jgi:two-component system chemotaxis response regulator CheB